MLRKAVLGVSLALYGAVAGATEFRSVAENAAVMYDAPSRESTPLYVASRFYPLEVIVNLGAWVRVRDHTGTLSWVERKSLSERRMVIVTAPAVEVKSRADEGAPAAFHATQNVALDLVEIAPGGWVRVRHLDGSSGFVKERLIWGL